MPYDLDPLMRDHWDAWYAMLRNARLHHARIARRTFPWHSLAYYLERNPIVRRLAQQLYAAWQEMPGVTMASDPEYLAIWGGMLGICKEMDTQETLNPPNEEHPPCTLT